jgi:hypothetical protein
MGRDIEGVRLISDADDIVSEGKLQRYWVDGDVTRRARY